MGMNQIGKFFLLCSGANLKIIDSLDEEYRPTAVTTFIGIGGAVFFTACMAVLSASFAIRTFVDNIYIILGIGLFWGFLIFNLDRYIVSSMRKRDEKWEELLIALPRVLVALLFAVVISKPLELAIFENGIKTQLPKIGDNRTHSIRLEIDSIKTEIDSLVAVNQKYNEDPSSAFVDSAQSRFQDRQKILTDLEQTLGPKIRKLESGLRVLYTDRRELRRKIREMDENIKSYEDASRDIDTPSPFSTSQFQTFKASKSNHEKELGNINFSIQQKNNELNGYKKQIGLADSSANIANQKYELEYQSREEIVKSEIDNNNEKINNLESLIQNKEEGRQKLAEGYDDLIAQLEALEALKKSEPIVRWADWLIFLLFITVETAPVLVKLITPKTQYDVRLGAFEETEKLTRRTQDVDKYWDAEKEKLTGEIDLLKKIHKEYRSILNEYIDKSMDHLRAEEERKFNKNKTGYALRMVHNPKEFFDRTHKAVDENRLEQQIVFNTVRTRQSSIEVFISKFNLKAVSIGILSIVLFGLIYFLIKSTSTPSGILQDENLANTITKENSLLDNPQNTLIRDSLGHDATNDIDSTNPKISKKDTVLLPPISEKSLKPKGIDTLPKEKQVFPSPIQERTTITPNKTKKESITPIQTPEKSDSLMLVGDKDSLINKPNEVLPIDIQKVEETRKNDETQALPLKPIIPIPKLERPSVSKPLAPEKGIKDHQSSKATPNDSLKVSPQPSRKDTIQKN